MESVVSAVLRICPKKISASMQRVNFANVQEIRIRRGKPLIITKNGYPLYVTKSGAVCSARPQDAVIPTAEDINELFFGLCGGSVYAHTDEIREGYISMPGGNRAGICGRVNEDGIYSDITSVNIRIAREVCGCADKLVKAYDGKGLLIAGPPGSGKTTLLRDFVRSLSEKGKRVAVVDTRGEISGAVGGKIFDLGDNTDVTIGIGKAKGIEAAVRCLNPQIVAFDEVGSIKEAKSVIEALNSGVYAVTTAHIADVSDLMRRSQTRLLINSGAINQIAVLKEIGDINFVDAGTVV